MQIEIEKIETGPSLSKGQSNTQPLDIPNQKRACNSH